MNEVTGPYYVYIYLNPLKKQQRFIFDDLEFEYEPFYVGKGKEMRYNEHLIYAINDYNDVNKHKQNTIKKIIKSNLNPIILFYSQYLCKRF